MDNAKKVRPKHFAKPTPKILFKQCTYPKYKERARQIRDRWDIHKLASSLDEAHGFWRRLCKESDYHRRWYDGQTPDRQFKRELETLAQDFGFVSDMSIALYNIVLCFDLDNVQQGTY